MKKYIHWVFGPVLSGCRSYRRWIGGCWYHIGDSNEGGGFAGPIHYWVRRKEAWQENLIIEVEQY